MDESILDTLFMELASESRRSILRILDENNEKLSKIAESLDITIQEAHRNSTRLVKCGLIDKKSNGAFSLTSLGKIIVVQIASWHFPALYKEYFENHTIGDLPPKFIRRLGDLQKAKLITGMGPVLENWKRLVNDADKFLRIIATQYPMDVARACIKKTNDGVPFYYIFDHKTTVPKERDDMLKKASWKKLIAEGLIQRKMVKKLQVCVAVTDKESCMFFPDLKENTDMMIGLFSTDPMFRDWCLDYFDHVWNNAESFDESKLQKV